MRINLTLYQLLLLFHFLRKHTSRIEESANLKKSYGSEGYQEFLKIKNKLIASCEKEGLNHLALRNPD